MTVIMSRWLVRLSTDIGLLQSTAKSRLNLPDNIVMRVVPQSELEIPGLGPQYAAASWDPNTCRYLIKFVLGRHIEDYDFFHEFCHLKLIQIGFKEVESVIQQRAELCRSEQEHEGMNNAVIFIAEAYANYLLLLISKRSLNQLESIWTVHFSSPCLFAG
jgi:hypothetical protein